MVFGPTPICLRCVRFHEDNKDGFTCDAFPLGIPDEIVLRGFNHNHPFPGDRGMRFVARVKFAVVGPEEAALSPFAQEVFGRATMGAVDEGFIARIRTRVREVEHALSDLPAKERKAAWKALYGMVDELMAKHRRK